MSGKCSKQPTIARRKSIWKKKSYPTPERLVKYDMTLQFDVMF